MIPLIDRAHKLRLKRDILRSRNANIRADITWFGARGKDDAVEILESYERANNKKIIRLDRRIDRITRKFANKGRHIANPRKKEKTDGC